ncbi:MAG: ubiquinol-cytochrome c reductase iron-sulfur subunit [Candidatus Latescibacteria bacterium]|nr:ubiquinol-cytochrome c reductase iron-sulfur subunit [Candidatus Latescibacterota bacterium]
MADTTKEGVSRRGFLSWLGLAWTAFSAAMAASGIALARFMFPNVLFEPPMSFKVGRPEEFALGVDERFKPQGVWIVKTTKEIFALSTVCTHLGCTPNWLSAEQKFKCPCHGSGYYVSGVNFEGPTPRPLERFAVFVADDGQVVVDKNRIFQYEKGQWTDPQSHILLS